MGNTVNIKINNIEVTAKKGQTILEAARGAGIHIPTLCYLKNINERIEDIEKSKNIIPNLLMEIMNTIPTGVQITEIENTTGRHVVIKAQSKQYEQLGYFKAKLKEDNILEKESVISSQAEKQDEYVKIVIEGELPWNYKNY